MATANLTVRRGGDNVDPVTGSSMSPPTTYGLDTLGCGDLDTVKDAINASILSRLNCAPPAPYYTVSVGRLSAADGTQVTRMGKAFSQAFITWANAFGETSTIPTTGPALFGAPAGARRGKRYFSESGTTKTSVGVPIIIPVEKCGATVGKKIITDATLVEIDPVTCRAKTTFQISYRAYIADGVTGEKADEVFAIVIPFDDYASAFSTVGAALGNATVSLWEAANVPPITIP